VWKSNPPPSPRRTASPALKAGKVTGPRSPPRLILGNLIRASKLLPTTGVSSGVSWFWLFDPGHCFVQVADRQVSVSASHRETFVPEQFRDIAERRSGLAQHGRIVMSAIVPLEILYARSADDGDKPMRIHVQSLSGCVRTTLPVPSPRDRKRLRARMATSFSGTTTWSPFLVLG
jgi:hypothetical protein